MAPLDEGGSTVWSGTSFDCPNSNNEITFLHNKLLANKSEPGECNNGSIVVHSLKIDPKNNIYTSQINVTINSDILGQTIICQYYDYHNIMTSTIGSLKLTSKGMLYIMYTVTWVL